MQDRIKGIFMTRTFIKKDDEIELFKSLFSKIGKNFIEIDLPIKTVPESNSSEHWTAKHKRHKAQKKTVYVMLKPLVKFVSLPCEITITRFAPRSLDRHDNLPYSLKWITDAITEVITGDFRHGRSDDKEEFDIFFTQTISKKYGVRIRISY